MDNKYNKVLLKLSGEALAGDKKTGFDEATCIKVATQVKKIVEDGVKVAVVIGGGNFWRGRSSETIDRVKADQIGMLATVMNCIYVSEIFRYVGMKAKIFTEFACGGMTELFSKDRVTEAMDEGNVVFLAGGTGHPYFSTDTATALRAIELGTDVILMARAVDGVYDSDPKENPNAKKFSTISFGEVLERKLKILDMTATVMCMENKMPLLLFSLDEENGIENSVKGLCNGTVVTP